MTSSIDRARSAGWYEGWMRSAIGDFKYRGESARARHLGELLVSLVDQMPIDACLAPVPLHPKRERQRGYNQSLLLAVVASDGRRPVRSLLARTRPTRQQVGLSAYERTGNVRGAFALSADAGVLATPVVLIDDVMTTGSTLGACAEILKAAGAPFVGVVTLARER
jgi:ComF family protein